MSEIKNTNLELEVESQDIASERRMPIFKSTIELLQHCQHVISENESYKGILKSFVNILHDCFDLTQAVYILDTGSGDDSEMKRGGVRFPPIKVIEEENVHGLRSVIRSMKDKDDEISLGFNSLRFDSLDYTFAVFADPSGHDGYLIWRQPPNSVKSPILRHLKEPNSNLVPILDFLTRSAQQACRWFRRLDKTQALLYQDEVTGLYNYRYLDVAIDGELKRLHRFHAPFSLLFIDLDNFKSINDVHGHLTGSLVLRQVGDVIKLAVRDVDNVIRYGGDEFVVVLIGANSRQAMQAAERVRSRIQNTTFKSDTKEAIRVTASIGVASCPEHGKDKTSILKMADETMYMSKKSGKNRVMIVSNPSVKSDLTQTKND